ncbi:MAG: nickel pincer cofactor biosynthesis protein LarB [Pirellulaceae bacterium]
MNREQLEQLARELEAGQISVQVLMDALESGVSQTAEQASLSLDLDRQHRCGFPEVIFGENKSPAALAHAFISLLEADQDVLATRVGEEKAEELCRQFPAADYNPLARTIRIRSACPVPSLPGHVVIVTAGTSDLAVAEEVRETLGWMGAETTLVQDVGVAGPQRLGQHLDLLRDADVVVVVAGLEGALPSVVGGHVDCPVIAVPTSIGYGASFGGVAALLGMLNSCASNVAVVNIDAGFKAGYVAGTILRRSATGDDPR